jgi:tRNA/rRNA methyltransferase
MDNMLNNIKVILCDTSHQGNIGSSARAMKTMGITNLVLVNPNEMPNDHAIALSCNANDVVENATILDNLNNAIDDCTLVIGLTSRKRDLNTLLYTPKQIVTDILSNINQNNKIALVFGSEKFGLSIEQINQCNRLVTIPGNPNYFSLNLSQAVQIMCYEIYSNLNDDLSHLKTNRQLATNADNNGVLNHIIKILNHNNYYQYKNPELTNKRIKHIIDKAMLERDEIDLIRGILKNIEQHQK